MTDLLVAVKPFKSVAGSHSSANTLLTLLDNLPGMVYRCRNDMDCTMEFVSSGCIDLIGHTPADLLQNKKISFGSLIHPEDRLRVWDERQAALQARQQYELVYRIRNRYGQEKWVRELGRGILDVSQQNFILEGFISDITAQKLTEQQLERQTRRLQALRKIDIAISTSFDLELTLDVLLEQITEELKVDAADILLYHQPSQTLEYAASRGFRTSALRHTHLRLGESFAGQAALSRQIVRIRDLSDTLGELRNSPLFKAEGFRSYFGVPLIAKGLIKGVLEIFHRSILTASEDWLEFLEAVAGQAAIALDNATLFHELQQSSANLEQTYDATLEGWARALELRDRETQGHAQRVIELTMNIAENLGIQAENFPHLRRGALLHDVGKMGIPDSILLKPGPLSSEEWKIMKQHPVLAYQWLSPISYLQPALSIPLYHHEKWDGTGYPKGLREEEIPLEARIFAVVDVWDALTSWRPYREAWSEEDAAAYIRNEAGKHFDPQVVEAFFKVKPNLKPPAL